MSSVKENCRKYPNLLYTTDDFFEFQGKAGSWKTKGMRIQFLRHRGFRSGTKADKSMEAQTNWQQY